VEGQSTETAHESGIRLNEDIKIAIITLFEELKETMPKEGKDIIKLSHQIENVNKETNDEREPGRSSRLKECNN
jgi:SMC interacting uncharacterized protein involved in chromosome segregation